MLLLMKRKSCENQYLLRADSGDDDGNSKPKLPKFISFSLFIRHVILNDLGDWNNIEDEICIRHS